MPKFSEYEKNIIEIFKEAKSFIWKDGKEYKIIMIGKPRPPKGECKTDAYVLAENANHEKVELKISIKKVNAEFLENKTTPERAEAILGSNWAKTIQNSTKTIEKEFKKRKLIFKRGYSHTQKGSITLGWKFEIMYHPGGDLSGTLKLTKEEIREVITGENLSIEKKNSIINKSVIKNSGISNYILFERKNETLKINEIIRSLISIDDFLREQKALYFACKALNYRSFHLPKPKWDSNRPLAVFVDWRVIKGKLFHSLVFDAPLSIKGNEVAEKLKNALKEIGRENTNDLNVSNVEGAEIIYE